MNRVEEIRGRNQPNISKPMLYVAISHYFCFNNFLRKLYISNKMECFCYKARSNTKISFDSYAN